MVLPGRKSGFRTGFWPDCYRASTDISPPAGLPPAGPIAVLSREQSGQNPARKHDCITLSTYIADGPKPRPNKVPGGRGFPAGPGKSLAGRHPALLSEKGPENV